jgi:esterase/lipase superfamily enzyme
MKLNKAVLISVLGSFLAASPWVFAKSTHAQKQYVTIPIFYVTDRNETKTGYGPQRKLEDVDTIDDMNFGSLDYSLETNEPINDQDKQLGWTESQTRPHKVLSTQPFAKMHDYHGFGQAVVDAAKKSGSDEVFIMVHGFNTPFAHAAKGAALLSHALHRPVILYSWPSKGKLAQYDVDLGNNDWSQEHFDAMVEELTRVKDSSGLKFNLLAHSMGNRLAIRSAPVLKGTHLFKQVFLVDPDFDAETFVHYLWRYARLNDTKGEVAGAAAVEPTKVRILFSHKDHALPLSETLFGGYTRLGQAADSLLSSVVAPFSGAGKIVEALDSSGTKDDTSSKSDKMPAWIMKFEWIDFTILDHGPA